MYVAMQYEIFNLFVTYESFLIAVRKFQPLNDAARCFHDATVIVRLAPLIYNATRRRSCGASDKDREANGS
jgi:hypothetical protein